MFTGIVEELGHVVAIEHGADSARLTVHGPLVTSDAAHGASIDPEAPFGTTTTASALAPATCGKTASRRSSAFCD